jgi:hypothetical protein
MGFHSGKTIRLVPNILNIGFIDEVDLGPLVSVNRMCVLSLIPLAANVRKILVSG